MSAHLATECGRDSLVAAIAMFLAREGRWSVAEVRDALARHIDDEGAAALARMSERLATTGDDWAYFPKDPLVRRIHRALADRILNPAPVLTGVEHLAAIDGVPVVIVANHLSYSDANVLDVVLARAGASELADRLTAIAGPKVYSTLRRRFSSLCFGTIKVPQSSALATEEASMTPRDVALAARRSLQAAADRLRQGDALVVFPEGTRSRSGRMQPFLPGVARYLNLVDDVRVLPIGLTGTERLFPVGDEALTPVPVTVRIGPSMSAADLHTRARGDRRQVMAGVAAAVAELLPPDYRSPGT